MDYNYYLIDPTGNITILVENMVPIKAQPKVGRLLMEKEPSCEQVGFISCNELDTESDITLRMAGGEFCGNATMSTAALYCKKNGILEGNDAKVRVRVLDSGALIPVVITCAEDSYFGKVTMPRPLFIGEEIFKLDSREYKLPMVTVDGISHIVVMEDMSDEAAERAVRIWCHEKNLSGLGLMLVDKDNSSMRPLVYIKDADTLFWESSCASGTSAVGAYLAYRDGEDKSLSLKQPGGTLTIEASKDGELILCGSVKFREK